MLLYFVSLHALAEHVLYSIKPIKFPNHILTLHENNIQFAEDTGIEATESQIINNIHLNKLAELRFEIVFANGVYFCRDSDSNFELEACKTNNLNSIWSIIEERPNVYSIKSKEHCLEVQGSQQDKTKNGIGRPCTHETEQLFKIEKSLDDRTQSNNRAIELIDDLERRAAKCKISDENENEDATSFINGLIKETETEDVPKNPPHEPDTVPEAIETPKKKDYYPDPDKSDKKTPEIPITPENPEVPEKPVVPEKPETPEKLPPIQEDKDDIGFMSCPSLSW
ncbi:hypothetical protein COBT_000117 [Conglomerata obtusa]